MKPQDAADRGAKDLEDRKDREYPNVSDSQRPPQANVQNEKSSIIVFGIDEKSYRRQSFRLFISTLFMCFIMPTIGYYAFDLADPITFCGILILVLCPCAVLSNSLRLWRVWKQRVVVDKDGIDLRLVPLHRFLSWRDTSHYVLHHYPISSRLDLFDHRGKRRMMISGFFDCVAIAEAIEMMGIPQRGKEKQ